LRREGQRRSGLVRLDGAVPWAPHSAAPRPARRRIRTEVVGLRGQTRALNAVTCGRALLSSTKLATRSQVTLDLVSEILGFLLGRWRRCR
jgi:hypothetical protein